MPAHAHRHSAEHEEVSRVRRFSRPDLLPESSKRQRFVAHLDSGAAFLVVVLATSGMLYATSWMLEHWQLR
jgi:hypothetical protein